MESLLGELPHVCTYLDDILITGESEAAHLQNLAAALEWLEFAGVRQTHEKYFFMISEVEYLGQSISAKGTQPVNGESQSHQRCSTTSIRIADSFVPGLLNYLLWEISSRFGNTTSTSL